MGEIRESGFVARARRALRWATALGVAALSFSPAAARAQARTLYLDRLFIGGAPDDAIGMWRPQMGAETRVFGQLGLGYAYEPLRVENYVKNENARSALGQPVKMQLITYADVGVEIMDRVAIQIEMPVILFQNGSPTRGEIASTTTAAAMDMRLDTRVIVFRNEARSFKLGAEAAIWLPTGNANAYAGDGSASGGLSIAAEYDLKKVFFVATTGPQFRPKMSIGASFNVHDEWRYSVGAFLPLRDAKLRLGAQIFGSVGIDQTSGYSAPNTPLEWMAEARLALGEKQHGWVSAGGGSRLTSGYAPDFRIVAVAGYWFGIADTKPPSPPKRLTVERFAEHGGDADKDGIPDDIDLCPTDPEDKLPPNTDDGCPRPPDGDGDGIADVDDKCPERAEDMDKIDDDDGCPEDDADKDAIIDAVDACPKEPGPASADTAKNGCPQFIERGADKSEIKILKEVQFATGKATILPGSFPILDEVVKLLIVNPDIMRLDIEGHTDNRGPIATNERLSTDRARAVMKYLVDNAIDAGRLTAQGYGPKRPIADNATAEGRQKNRRVEFHIRNEPKGQKPGESAPPPSR